MQTDVLIVGSGCAGLYCALNLPKDKNILMITKDIVELLFSTGWNVYA